MKLDEVAQALEGIKNFEPCPMCGAVRADSETEIVHGPNCPFPNEVVRLDAQKVEPSP